jgi:hypothetical protein
MYITSINILIIISLYSYAYIPVHIQYCVRNIVNIHGTAAKLSKLPKSKHILFVK